MKDLNARRWGRGITVERWMTMWTWMYAATCLLAASAAYQLSKVGLGPGPTVRCGRDAVGEVCDQDVLKKSV